MRTDSTSFHYQRHDSIRSYSELFEALHLEFAPDNSWIKIDSTGAVELHGVRHAVAERKQKAESSITTNEQKDSTQAVTAKEDRHEATQEKTADRNPVVVCILLSIVLILMVSLIILYVRDEIEWKKWRKENL